MYTYPSAIMLVKKVEDTISFSEIDTSGRKDISVEQVIFFSW